MHPLLLQTPATPENSSWENFLYCGFLVLIAAIFFGALGIALAFVAKEEQKRKDAVASRFRQLGFGATSRPRDFERKLAFGELRDLPAIWKKLEPDSAYFRYSNPHPDAIALIARGAMRNQQVTYIEHVRLVYAARGMRRFFDYSVIACVAAGNEAPSIEESIAEKVSTIPAFAQLSSRMNKHIEMFRQGDARFLVMKGRAESEHAVWLAEAFAAVCDQHAGT